MTLSADGKSTGMVDASLSVSGTRLKATVLPLRFHRRQRELAKLRLGLANLGMRFEIEARAW